MLKSIKAKILLLNEKELFYVKNNIAIYFDLLKFFTELSSFIGVMELIPKL